MKKEEIEAKLEFSEYVKYTLELEGKVKELEEENRKIKKEEIRAKESWRDLYREQLEKNKKQEEKIRFLEECLDNKEKVNQSLREEIEKDNREVQVDVDKELLKANDYLIKENKKLKADLDKFSEAYKKYRDFEKEELAESCYDLARENDRLKEELGKLVMSKSKD